MGDPCGIGPEIVAKSLARPLPAPCVVVGDVAVMRRAVAACDLQWPVAELDEPEQARRAAAALHRGVAAAGSAGRPGRAADGPGACRRRARGHRLHRGRGRA